MKTWTAQEIWNVVNKIPCGSSAETKRRCQKTEEWLGKINAPCLMQEDWKGDLMMDEVMETICHLYNDACHATA